MVGKLFKRKPRNEWIVTIKNGDMLRRCERTGEVQYRDCATKSWVPVEEGVELNEVRDEMWITPARYAVESGD